MFRFGKKPTRLAPGDFADKDPSASHTLPETTESLAMSGGTAKAANEAANASAASSGVQIAAAQKTDQGSAGVAAAQQPALAAEGQEANRMDQSTGNQKAPSTNGNGAQSGPASPFTEAAPQGAAKKVSEVLGEIVWLMSQSPIHKRLFIQDLEWFVMTPILLKQFRTFYAKDRPIGVVLWAYANEEVAAMLGEGTTKLRPQDWDGRPKKGAGGAPQASEDTTQIWIVEAIAPFGGAEEMVKDLKAKVFPEREVRYLATGPQGKQVKVA